MALAGELFRRFDIRMLAAQLERGHGSLGFVVLRIGRNRFAVEIFLGGLVLALFCEVRLREISACRIKASDPVCGLKRLLLVPADETGRA